MSESLCKTPLSFGQYIGQSIGIPIDTYCAPLVANCFFCWCEGDFRFSFSDNNQADGIEAFNSTLTSLSYLDELLYIDNSYFEQMLSHKYSTNLQLNKANYFDTEALFLDLSITNGIVSSKI